MTESATEMHLRVLFARADRDLLLNVRLFSPNGRVEQVYDRVSNIETWSSGALHAYAKRRNQEGWGVFVGVHPRVEPSGKGSAVAGYACLPLDVDDRAAVNAAIARLADAGLHLGMIVRSGRPGHAHAYLLLDRLHPVAEAQPVAKRLAKWIVTSDPVFYPALVLRLAGFNNMKEGLARPVEIHHLDPERRYTLVEVTAALDRAGAPELPAPKPRGQTITFVGDDGVTGGCNLGNAPARAARAGVRSGHSAEEHSDFAPLAPENVQPEVLERLRAIVAKVPERVRRLVAEFPPRGQRSEAELACVRALVEAGAELEDLVLLARLHPAGLGARCAERDTLATIEGCWMKVRESSRPERPRSRVRVTGVGFDPKRGRLLLDLAVVSGAYAPAVITNQGVSVASGIANDVLAAFGFATSPGKLDAWVGREADVVLGESRRGFGVEVVRWRP